MSIFKLALITAVTDLVPAVPALAIDAYDAVHVADEKAHREVQKLLLRKTYDHMDTDDCRILVTYTDGAFRRH